MAGILAMARGRDAVIPEDKPEEADGPGQEELTGNRGADPPSFIIPPALEGRTQRTHAQMSPVQRSDMPHTSMNPLGDEHTRMGEDE